MVRLLQVLHDDILLEHHGLRAILDLISSYQEIDPWDQNYLTDRGRELLSDLWTMCEILYQLERYYPLANTLIEEPDLVNIWENDSPSTNLRQLGTFKCSAKDARSSLVDTTQQLNYPVNETRTAENSVVIRNAEQLLSNFWGSIDSKLAKPGTHTVSSRYLSVILESKDLVKHEKTPTWKVYQQSHQAEQAGEVTKTTTPVHPRAIGIDARAYNVVRLLFPHKSFHSKQGTMRWRDFVYFMDRFGFTVLKQTIGSGWIFKPSDAVTVTDIRTRLGFHMGHRPGAAAGEWQRYQYIDAGKKLTRELEITGDMFFLKNSPNNK